MMMMVIDDDVKKHEETALNAKYVFVFYFVSYCIFLTYTCTSRPRRHHNWFDRSHSSCSCHNTLKMTCTMQLVACFSSCRRQFFGFLCE